MGTLKEVAGDGVALWVLTEVAVLYWGCCTVGTNGGGGVVFGVLTEVAVLYLGY